MSNEELEQQTIRQIQDDRSNEQELAFDGSMSDQEELKKKRIGVFSRFIAGEFLVVDGVKRSYKPLMAIAICFFVNILTFFALISTEISNSKLNSRVELLHEKSIMMQEEFFKATSHSSIIERLEAKGITLIDPQKPSVKI